MEMLIMASGGLKSIASTLGYMDGDQYILSEYCEDVLEEMLDSLKHENKVTRPVRLNIGGSTVLESDLLHILSAAEDDLEVFRSVLKLLVNLSMPLELILPVHPNMTKTDWQQRHTLQAMLLTIKKHFIQEKPVRAIVEQMSTHLEHHGAYRMDKDSMVLMNDCLVLIRNILHIEENAGEESNHIIVRHMLDSKIGDVIHSMLDRDEAETWIAPMVQVIRLILRDQTSQDLVKQAVKLYEKGTLFTTDDPKQTPEEKADVEVGDKPSPWTSIWEKGPSGLQHRSLFLLPPIAGAQVASDSGCDSGCNVLSDFERSSKAGGSSSSKSEQDLKGNIYLTQSAVDEKSSSSGCDSSSYTSQSSGDSPSRSVSLKQDMSSSSDSSTPSESSLTSDASPPQDVSPPEDGSLSLGASLSPEASTSPSSVSSLLSEPYGYQDSPGGSPAGMSLQGTPWTVSGISGFPRCTETTLERTVGDAPDLTRDGETSENPCRTSASQMSEEDDSCSRASGNGSTFSRSSENGSSSSGSSETGSFTSSTVVSEVTRQKEALKNLLCKFAIRFCQHGLNRCIILCQDNMLQHLNDCYVLWCMSYFLPFSTLPCVSYNDVRHNLSSMVVTYLIYITLNTWESFTMATNNASDSKSNILFRRLYLLVASLRQILTTARRFMEQDLQPDEKEHLHIFIKCLCQLEGIRKLYVLLLRKFRPKNESIQYLRALVVGNDELLRIISSKDAYAIPGINHINCEEHVRQLASRQVLLTYNELLQKFNSNTREENEAVFTLMYHTAVDLNNPKLVYQLLILDTFADLWEQGPKDCISQSSWNLIDYIVGRFTESSRNNPDIFLNQTMTTSSRKRMYVELTSEDTCTSEDLSKDEFSCLAMKPPLSKRLRDGVFIHTVQSSSSEDESAEKHHVKSNLQTCIKSLTIKGYKPQIRALQKLLLETCYAKLACPKTEVVEPLVWLNHIQMKSVPLFTYSQADEMANDDPHFQEVLQHLGLHSSKDSQHLFPSIPAFWTAEMCFSAASMLGEIQCDKLKFAMTPEGELMSEYLEVQTPGVTNHPSWPEDDDVEEQPEEKPSTSRPMNRISTLPRNMWLSVIQQLNADKEEKS
ncbi:protein timeless-like [Asterias rubens]|uniref:protein timeless-like n=1 Tax=Asterias rubens TaxID=7604 RepID=UPI0014552481|nr:protein timeless-like [Asterias rubens]